MPIYRVLPGRELIHGTPPRKYTAGDEIDLSKDEARGPIKLVIERVNSKEKVSKSKPEEEAAASSTKLDINSASKEELEAIKHIGPATADKIMEARPFDNLDQAFTVSDMEEGKWNQIKGGLTVE